MIYVKLSKGLLFLLSFGLVVLSTACSDDTSDVDDIAESLADRLTKALDFDQSDKESGTPPAGNDGPAIESVDMPEEFRMDASFRVRVLSSDIEAEKLDFCYVYVQGASRFFEIEKSALADGTGEGIILDITGALDQDDQLAGEDFTVEFSLRDTQGNIGPVFPMPLHVSRLEAECNLGDCCNAGQWVPSGEACLSGEDVYSCTSDRCSADHACEADLDSGFCLIDETCTAEGTEKEDKECQLCAPDQNSDSWTAKENGTPCLYDTAADSGDCQDGECVLNLPTRLAESLNLDSAQLLSESKPPSDDAAGFEIDNLVGPIEIRLSSDFFFHLHTTKAPEEFQGAVLSLEGARRTWEFATLPVRYRDHYRMRLEGHLAQNEVFHDTEATFWIAFRAADGQLGAYQSHTVTIPQSVPECSLSTCCNGGAYLPEGFSCDAEDFCMLSPTCTEDGACTGSRYSCNNRGACNEHDDTCTCNQGFAGDFCEGCAEGYTGDYCQHCAEGYYEYPEASNQCVVDPCYDDPCNGHGTCDNSQGSALCTCDDAYESEDCSACKEETLGSYPYCFLPPDGFCQTSECHAPAPSEQDLCYDDSEVIDCPGTAGDASCSVTSFCGQDAQYEEEASPWQCLDENGTVLQSCPEEVGPSEMVQDSQRGLLWHRTVECELSYQEAQQFCQSSAVGGIQTWRLPSPHELHNLIDEGRSEPACDADVWGTPSGLFWTSQPNVAHPTYTWTVDFDLGRLNHATQTEAHCLRCVAEAP